jgi:hypothetical protein
MTRFFLFLLLAVLFVVFVFVLVMRHQTGLHGPEWESGILDESPRKRREREQTYPSLTAAIGALRSRDPEFSFVLFEDFAYALYAEAHTARGERRLDSLAPYLTPPARAALQVLSARPVRTVIVGSMRVERVTIGRGDRPTEVVAVFESNYAEIEPDGAEQAYYAAERWTFARPVDVKSRPPERARVIDCPSCGAPLDKIVGGKCGYCAKVVDKGELDWTVVNITGISREARPPMLTGTTEEVGTSDPTITADDVQERWAALTARDRALDWALFTARIELVFKSFHEAWAKQEPLRVRPYLSDNLFQTQLYWIDAYRRQKLRNLTDGARIVTIHLCRVMTDAHYDAITVRVFATGLDYTVNEAGEVVGGTKERERAYSEYWTLIRGASRTGAPRTTPECPSCGAGLDVNMAGSCNFCSAKVTAGEFDWVLSRIEQDEVYSG